MLKQRAIYVLLGLYLILANIYGLVTPVMEASDELWHYPMVKYIADHGALPIQEPGVETPWRQEGSQPPLYYAFAALLTAWIDTSDLEQVRWINPHADNGIIRPDGNANLIVHRPQESFPWRGTVLAIHLIRFVSVCMGAGTVYLTYLLVRQIWPTQEVLALAAAAIAAFNPMFCFISGSVNNDNLAMLLGAAGIWLLVRLVSRHGGPAVMARSTWWRDSAILGIVLGLALLTKPSTVGLLPLTALAVAFVARQRRSWWYLFTGGIVTAGLVVLLSGWWFLRNALLYGGDWTGIERFIVILGYRDPPATLRQLWGERQGFMMAYWGLFGGVNVPMPGWIYRVLNGVLLMAGVGLLVWVLKWAIERTLHRPLETRPAGPTWIARWMSTPHAIQLALLALWPLAVILPWISWATRTWSSQGRLIFTAMSAWSAWTALGLSQFLPRPRSAWLPGGVAVWMLGVAVWAPWGVIAPAYRAPLWPAETTLAPEHALQVDVGGQLWLLGYDLETLSARPGEAFHLRLYWEAQQQMDRNWSIFFHLLDLETGLPIATRDRFPGQGLLATSLMAPGTRWADDYVIDVPRTTYAPAEVVLEVGLYDWTTQERPPIQVKAGEVVAVVDNALRFQPLRIEAYAGDVPNPAQINFQDRLMLVGWDIDRRAAEPGQETSLALHWQCLAPMDRAYTVSVQLLDDRGHKAAQWDSWPGDLDTSSCTAGQRIVDVRTLSIYPDAPPGGYRLALMIYDSSSMKRLRIVDAQGRILPEDRVFLDWVRVGL